MTAAFNVRASTVLGVVGAGGIGQELKNSMDLLDFARLFTIIAVILVVVKAFNGHAAIEDVSFTMGEHEFVGSSRPQGAGKTTLFRCVAGLLAPDRGTAWIGDDDIAALRGRRRRVAVVFQQFNLVSRLTALDNVLAGRLGYVPAWRGWLRRFDRRDRLLALECLDRVGLLAHASQRADRLSGGQQQGVAIARALAQRPISSWPTSPWRASTRMRAPGCSS